MYENISYKVNLNVQQLKHNLACHLATFHEASYNCFQKGANDMHRIVMHQILSNCVTFCRIASLISFKPLSRMIFYELKI